ncbi:MAG: hypothetical protein WC679_13535 [Bacteroidales bacterium]|jgi:hypothetical protein
MKLKPQKDVIENFDMYVDFMKAEKLIKSPFTLDKQKQNHCKSLYSCDELSCVISFGNVTLNGEIRNSDKKDYSFYILTDIIKSRVVFRYDTGDGVHKNDVPYIPLSQQSIDAPHFHHFNKDGYFLAYKTDKLTIKGEVDALSDIDFGFPYFCQEVGIKRRDNKDIPELIVRKDGEIGFFFDNVDPNEGISF